MVLIIGGSGSGKSAYAEEMVVSLAKKSASLEENILEMKKYYLAAMQAFDEEGKRRVKRHRELRSGKGFLTIEQPTEIHKALEQMEEGDRAALLECISNLTANEMFKEGEARPETQTAEQIVEGVKLLKEKTTHLVVVSNNVFEDGVVYDKATMAYIRGMGIINQSLAKLSDQVVEVVAGIPIVLL